MIQLSRKWRVGTMNFRLFIKQRGECCYCGCEMTLPLHGKPPYAPNVATREHLRRKVDGGDNAPDNLAIACKSCNSRRGSMSWIEFKTLAENRSRAA